MVRLLQSAGALQRKLEDEEMLMNEVQRDKERFDQRRGIEERVRPELVGFEYSRVLPCARHPGALKATAEASRLPGFPASQCGNLSSSGQSCEVAIDEICM